MQSAAAAAAAAAVEPRRYTLRIENFHPGPEDTRRTNFNVKGNTVDEVLENIIWNTQPSFGLHEEMFRKTAHLHYSSLDAVLKRNELLSGQPMPADVEYLYLYFRLPRSADATPNSLPATP